MRKSKRIFFAFLFACLTLILIIIKKQCSYMAKVDSYNSDFATLKISKSCYIVNGEKCADSLILNNDKNKIENEDYIKTNTKKSTKESGIKNIDKFANEKIKAFFSAYKLYNVNIKDISAPEKVENIKVNSLENKLLLNLDEPKDNGTSYNYFIKNNYLKNKNKNKNKTLNFYSESGIKGYCYEINSSNENIIHGDSFSESNKIELSNEEMSNLDFDKDLFLHIKTIDNNLNESECNTIKLIIPSGGLEVKYIDMNSNEEIKDKDFISGNVNDEYDLSNKINIDGYKIINNEVLKGKLKRKQKNIKVKFSKIKDVKIQYLDENGNKIKDDYTLKSYEGEKINIVIPKINNYKFNSGPKEFETKGDESKNIVKLIYSRNNNKITSSTSKLDNKDAKESNNIKYNTNENLKNNSYETSYDEVDAYGCKRHVTKKVTYSEDGTVNRRIIYDYH